MSPGSKSQIPYLLSLFPKDPRQRLRALQGLGELLGFKFEATLIAATASADNNGVDVVATLKAAKRARKGKR